MSSATNRLSSTEIIVAPWRSLQVTEKAVCSAVEIKAIGIDSRNNGRRDIKDNDFRSFPGKGEEKWGHKNDRCGFS